MRHIVLRLIKRETSRHSGGNSVTDGVVTVCEETYRALSRWVGEDGCHALFSRSFAETRIEFHELAEIELNAGKQPYLSGIAEAKKKHDDASIAGALESMLFHLFTLLSRLLGEDMANKLIEQGFASNERVSAKTTRRSEIE